MDETRYTDLIAKRDSQGLSDDEANELGRLEAEREGVPYEGHGPDAKEADLEAAARGRHGPGDESASDPTGPVVRDEDRTTELERR